MIGSVVELVDELVWVLDIGLVVGRVGELDGEVVVGPIDGSIDTVVDGPVGGTVEEVSDGSVGFSVVVDVGATVVVLSSGTTCFPSPDRVLAISVHLY